MEAIPSVFICYRVNQRWRSPLFKLLTSRKEFRFKLLVSSDFRNSKVCSGSFDGIKYKKFASISIDISLFGKRLQVPWSIGLLRYLISEKPDLIIVEGRSNFINSIKCVVYGLIYRKPVYQWGLGELRNANRLDRIKSLPFLAFERLSTGAITYSSFGAQYYKNVVKLEPSRVHVAVNTIDDRHISLRPIRSAPTDLFNFLFVGAIERQKKVDLLIHSFSIVANEVANASLSIKPVLNIVGDGSELASCKKLASNLGFNSVINFHGALLGSQLARFFDDSHLLVMPGLGGLVISESICYNLPVLCSVGDGSEVDWLSNGSGLISGFRSADQLAQEMMSFLLHPNLIPEMSLKCLESRKKYSFDSYASVFLDVIHENIQKN